MKRAKIIAKGKVQKVGYRDRVEEIARKLNITGFVENLKPYDVRIVAEGEDGSIDKFIEQIEIRKFPIDVEGLEVTFEGYKGEFEYFEIKTGEWQQELLERFDTAGTLLYKCVELGERSVELGEKNVALSERSVALDEESVSIGKKMLEKQDDTIEAIEQSKEEIVTEISSLRGDLKSYMENKFAKIEREIAGIKAKIGMI
jgi:acylphosphatase